MYSYREKWIFQAQVKWFVLPLIDVILLLLSATNNKYKFSLNSISCISTIFHQSLYKHDWLKSVPGKVNLDSRSETLGCGWGPSSHIYSRISHLQGVNSLPFKKLYAAQRKSYTKFSHLEETHLVIRSQPSRVLVRSEFYRIRCVYRGGQPWSMQYPDQITKSWTTLHQFITHSSNSLFVYLKTHVRCRVDSFWQSFFIILYKDV